MHKAPYVLLAALLALGLAAACDTDSSAPLEIDAEGSVVGLAWLDRNGSGQLQGTYVPVRDVRIQLHARGGGAALFSAMSDGTGEFGFPEVPVGDYRVVVDESTVGDTIRLMRIDSAEVTVEAGETKVVLVGFSFPAVPIDSVRRTEIDTRLFIEGFALNSWQTFGDSTVHVRDTTGAIRAVRAPPIAVSAGDSIRMLGTVRMFAGQRVLQDVSAFMLRTGSESPPPVDVTARMARLADDGRLDAELVRLDSAVIRDTTRSAVGEMVFTVEDASGTARVLLDRDIPFQIQFPTVIIGTILDVRGLLVPATTPGEWVLKPRGSLDITVGPLAFPTMDIVDARREPVDARLIVFGRALNAWAAFGDSTVHVRDRTGAIRAIRVPPTNIQAGDSIRVVGTIASFLGQPVLRQVHTTILDVGIASPPADSISTGAAAAADAGRLDADLVRIGNAAIQDTTRNAEAELVLIVDDGSGPVRVVLDRNVPFFLNWPRVNGQPQVIGTRVHATGVLIPRGQGTGEWLMKPRANSDVELRSGG